MHVQWHMLLFLWWIGVFGQIFELNSIYFPFATFDICAHEICLYLIFELYILSLTDYKSTNIHFASAHTHTQCGHWPLFIRMQLQWTFALHFEDGKFYLQMDEFYKFICTTRHPDTSRSYQSMGGVVQLLTIRLQYCRWFVVMFDHRIASSKICMHFKCEFILRAINCFIGQGNTIFSLCKLQTVSKW